MNRKILFCAAALCCALFCTGCDIEEMNTLRDVSRPFAGEYKCRKLSLGGEDLLPRFEYIKLELGYFGDFTLKYVDEQKGEGEYGGKYEMGENTVLFRTDAGGEEKKYVFPYESGAVLVELPLGGKLLLAEFRAV